MFSACLSFPPGAPVVLHKSKDMQSGRKEVTPGRCPMLSEPLNQTHWNLDVDRNDVDIDYREIITWAQDK